MENKVFITKYQSAVNNDELLRLGELRIKYKANPNATIWSRGLCFDSIHDTSLELIGGSSDYFKTESSNLGRNVNYLTNTVNQNSVAISGTDDIELAILNKYNLTCLQLMPRLGDFGKNGYGKKDASFDISQLRFSTKLTNLDVSNSAVSGDISNLKNLTNLIQLAAVNSAVSGDISNLKNLTNLTDINLTYCINISGDISALSSLSAITKIAVNNTSISGSLDSIANLTNLKNLELPDTVTATKDTIKVFTDRGCTVTIGANKYNKTN